MMVVVDVVRRVVGFGGGGENAWCPQNVRERM